MIAIRSVAVAIAFALFAIDLASVALFAPLGRPPSLVRGLSSSWPFALAEASGANRVPAVRVELARAALVRGEPDRAETLLAGLPMSGEVADVRGRVALARGRSDDAVAAFGAAGDIVRARAAIDVVAAHDSVAAYALAAAFVRDAVRRNEPAPVQGQASWRAGELAVAAGIARPAEAARYNRIALGLYRDAVRDDPTQEAYVLADGMASLIVGDAAASRDAYRRAVDVVRDSVDGYVGLAVSEARLGDCAAARAALAQAQSFAARQHRAVDVAASGYDATTRDALQRCTADPN